MASNFSCLLKYSEALKEQDAAVFQSDANEIYRVKYRTNIRRDLLLHIGWTIPKHVVITVKLYNKTFMRCLSSKGSVVKGNKTVMKLRGAFNVCSSPNYNILCIISIIPYINFNEKTEVSDCGSKKDTIMKINSLMDNTMTEDNSVIINAEALDKNVIIEAEMCQLHSKLEEFSACNHDLVSDDKTLMKNMEKDVSNLEEANNGSSSANSENKFGFQEKLNEDHYCDVALSDYKDDAMTLSDFVKDEHINENQMQGLLNENFLTAICMDEDEITDVEDKVSNTFSSSDASAMMESSMEQKSPMLRMKVQNLEVNELPKETTINNTEVSKFKELLQNDISVDFCPPLDVESQEFSLGKQNFTLNGLEVEEIVSKDLDIFNSESSKQNPTKSDQSQDIESEILSIGACDMQNITFDELGYEAISTDTKVNDVTPSNISSKIGSTIDITYQGLSENQSFKVDICNKEIISNEIQDLKTVSMKANMLEDLSMPVQNVKLNCVNDVQMNCTEMQIDKKVEPYSSGKTTPEMLITDRSNFTLNNLEDIKSISNSNVISSDPEVKPTIQNFSVDNHEDNVPCNMYNEVLHKTGFEVDNALVSNSDMEVDPLIEIGLQKFSEDRYNFRSDVPAEIVRSSTPLESTQSMESNNAIEKLELSSIKDPTEHLSIGTCNLIAEGSVDDTEISDTPLKVGKSISSVFLPEKNELETVIQISPATSHSKASDDVCNTILSNIANKTHISTECNRKSKKKFPLMECEFHGLSMDMLDLLMLGEMTDAIISNGKKEMKVHTNILSARSSAFKKLFSCFTRDSMEKRVFVDIPSSLLEDIVVFIYAGVINIQNKQMARDLYKIAEKYCITDLIDICKEHV